MKLPPKITLHDVVAAGVNAVAQYGKWKAFCGIVTWVRFSQTEQSLRILGASARANYKLLMGRTGHA